MPVPRLLVLGTRGVPAAHGGFETFAEKLALFLVTRGWHVTVYCQRDVETVTQRYRFDEWHGIHRITIEVSAQGPRATLEFDWHCTHDAARRKGVCLVLGYNSAVFLPYLRAAGRKILTNMDGIEWKRPKWSLPVRAWFWLNEWIAAWSSHRLIADHPRIADHLATRRSRSKIVTIPYGADPVGEPPADVLSSMGLEPGRYLVSIARVEPDNNIALLVEAFSRRRRGMKLVVLGTLSDTIPYHRQVRAQASDEVVFPGAIYDGDTVRSLRYHARAYLHGHTVGGTNPSLVEALWAGNAVLAHDNMYNRWTAGGAALYFDGLDACAASIDTIVSDDAQVAHCRAEAQIQAQACFKWDAILSAYEHEILALSGPPLLSPSAPWPDEQAFPAGKP